ncbi:serine hydrolase [Legionella busanensis]|uniref:serine hydrolase n=1 Tax=Legionella busanensis TaxID=190655 RepID=UPI001F5EE54A|nr:serine hydrolase [Legionella busanensis]
MGALISNSTFAGQGRGDYHVLYHGQSIDDLVIKYMEKNNIPGLSLAIVQAPYITRVVGYGIADIQSQQLVSSNSVFNVGEITNVVTAIAIMQLKEERKLKLEDSITKYLPSSLGLSSQWNAITIQDLIMHSSGLASYTDEPSFDFAKDYTPTEIINIIKDKPLLFNSGTQAYKSSTNYYLLGLIIENTSGMSYEDYVTKKQIEPLGLKHTYFIANKHAIKNEFSTENSSSKHSQFLHVAELINPTELANGYLQESSGSLVAIKPTSWSASFANSGLIASSADISTWDIGLAGDILVKDAKDRAFLFNPITLKNGKTIPGNTGWLFPGRKGLMEIKGNMPGYSSFLSRFTAPDELLCVTLLANKGDLPDLDILGRKIAGAFDARLAAPLTAPWVETIQSPYSVKETMERVATLVKAQGGKVFAHIDHSGEAQQVGQKLPMTEVLIIGNPAKGTAMMQAIPAIAIDLPLRVMATTDETGQVWLSFTDPVALAKEYTGDAKQAQLYKPIAMAVRKLCQRAVSPYTVN